MIHKDHKVRSYWARICKPFKKHRNRFPAWRNRFLGIDSWAPKSLTKSGAESIIPSLLPYAMGDAIASSKERMIPEKTYGVPTPNYSHLHWTSHRRNKLGIFNKKIPKWEELPPSCTGAAFLTGFFWFLTPYSAINHHCALIKQIITEPITDSSIYVCTVCKVHR
jgi:hypothetical protein